MNDWWKLALAGTAAAGLTALSGGAAAPLLSGLMAGEGAAGAGAAAGAAGAAAAEGAAAAGTAAAGAGVGASAAGVAGAAEAGAGATSGLGLLATPATGASTGGLLATPEATGAMAYTTPTIFPEAVAQGAMPSAYGDLAGEQLAMANGGATPNSLASGMDAAGQYHGLTGELSGAAQTGPVLGEPAVGPSMWDQAKGYMDKAEPYMNRIGKAASAYQTVNGAGGGQQPQHQAPQGRPIFQGQAPQISQPMQQAPDNFFVQGLLAKRQRNRGLLG